MDQHLVENYIHHYHTPFYLYDLDVVQNKIDSFTNYLSCFNLLYSVKANPHPDIIRQFINNRCGFDVASVNELILVSSLGADPSLVYYSTPGKTEADIRYAFGRCNIIADSVNEIKCIDSVANSLHQIASIGIRINVTNRMITKSKHEVMGGVSTKFGISLDEISLLDFSKLRNICISGIHLYFGSQLLDEELIINNFNIIAEVATLLLPRFNLRFINFGGGFGVPYLPEETPLNLNSLSESVLKNKMITDFIHQGIRLNIELGRFLVAECGSFFTSVVDVKCSFGKKYIILDSGMNTFYRPIMTREYHDVVQFSDTIEYEKVTLVGRLCTPIDTYYEDISLKEIHKNDIIAFANAGAYGYSMSLLNFISYDPPGEYVVGGNNELSLRN